jgi:hypothetical protein
LLESGESGSRVIPQLLHIHESGEGWDALRPPAPVGAGAGCGVESDDTVAKFDESVLGPRRLLS